jgi:hypothetical protein
VEQINVTACITSREGKPDYYVHEALQKAATYAASYGIQTRICISSDPYSVAMARNRGVAQLLKDPSATHLFFLDNDVHIAKDAIVILAACQSPVAAGCYPSFKNTTSSGDNRYLCQPYLTVKVNGEWMMRWFDGVAEVEEAGTGCMLIRRDVLEDLGYPWFVWREWLTENGDIDRFSDDVDFCRRARARGHKIVAHGNVRCGHTKQCDVANFMFEEGAVQAQWLGPQTVRQQEEWPEYGSHIPCLHSIAKAFEIKTVVEYGCGVWSTGTFLTKDVFTDLQELTSYESDYGWLNKIIAERSDDPRVSFTLCPLAKMTEHLHSDVDLVFIDAGADDEDPIPNAPRVLDTRVALIEAYAKLKGDFILVVHDCNFFQLAPAVEKAEFKYKALYTAPKVADGEGSDTMVMSHTQDVTTIEWMSLKRKHLMTETPVGGIE